MKTLEICTGDPEGILTAFAAGADRIELCSGLAEGGLTPSIAAVRFASGLKQGTVNVLIRPRAGHFVYTPAEVRIMTDDIRAAMKAGASGIAVGALTPDGRVDEEACRIFIEAAGPVADSTFHRAFDVTRDPYEALETIIGLGFRRILTSGQAASALEGAQLIARLRKQAAGRIEIMAGAGVCPENGAEILRLTDADALHASARSLKKSSMATVATEASMGSADASDGSRMATDYDKVNKLHNLILL